MKPIRIVTSLAVFVVAATISSSCIAATAKAKVHVVKTGTISGSVKTGSAQAAAPGGSRAAVSRANAATGGPVIGSPNTISADPPVARPATTPCVVTLFSGFTFSGFDAQTFNFTPPSKCPGPWAKVVFEADFAVSEGTQYDRTGEISLGHVNIYYGTTAEPFSNFGPSWHVERDVTDYSKLFTTAQSGEVDLGNVYNSQYNGLPSGSAYLEFYPVASGTVAPVTADAVLPMPDTAGGAVGLNSTSSQLSETFTLPKNIQSAYLDVIAQSQSSDEFWYTCYPNDLAADTGNCGSTGFREVEVTIDGTPAGLAPVFPWIYTGGIDPYLWSPIPGVQTLDFQPYRVDLSPFAGVLSNGSPHTVAVSVFNADNYFLVTSTLLLYEDHGTTQVTGAVTQNTLTAAPVPSVIDGVDFSTVNGTVTVGSARKYTIAGTVSTSHGAETVTVQGNTSFTNSQQLVNTDTTSVQNITQITRTTQTTSVVANGITTAKENVYYYPLTAFINFHQNSDGTYGQTTTIHQELDHGTQTTENGAILTEQVTENIVAPTDTLDINAALTEITGNSSQSSSQTAVQTDLTGYCYGETLAAANSVLTSATSTARCPSVNSLWSQLTGSIGR